MSSANPESKIPTLASVREHLQSNSNVLFMEHSEPWSLKSSPNANNETLEQSTLLIAPATPIYSRLTLVEFADQILSGFGLHERRGPRDYEWHQPYTIPIKDFSEIVGIRKVEVLDEEILRRYDKLGSLRYRRYVELKFYPDWRIADLYDRYLRLDENHGSNPLPPGTQNDLRHLWTGLTPQLYNRWLDGENLSSFYFAPEGSFIPRFYRIPTSRIEQARTETPPGYFFDEEDFTEPFQIVNGRETGAKLFLYRQLRNWTYEDLALIACGDKDLDLNATRIRLFEQGTFNPIDNALERLLLALGVSQPEFSQLQIFPKGHSSTYRRCEKGGGLRLAFVSYKKPQSELSPEDANPFGTRLREMRLEKSYSQIQIAERAGLSQSKVSSLERGISKYPDEETLKRVVTSLELNDTETLDFILAFEKQFGASA